MTFESLNVKVDPDTVMIGVVPSPPAVADLKTRYSVMPVPMLDGALQFNWIWPALANAVRRAGRGSYWGHTIRFVRISSGSYGVDRRHLIIIDLSGGHGRIIVC